MIIAIFTLIVITQNVKAHAGKVHTHMGIIKVQIEKYLLGHPAATTPRGCDPNSGYCPRISNKDQPSN